MASEDPNITFSRLLLRDVVRDVRKHFPEIKVSSAYVYKTSFRDHYEFHGPEEPGQKERYYNGSIHASNAYEARYAGWNAWLKTKGIADY